MRASRGAFLGGTRSAKETPRPRRPRRQILWVEAFEAIPFPGANRAFSMVCGAISGRIATAAYRRCNAPLVGPQIRAAKGERDSVAAAPPGPDLVGPRLSRP